ncbi:hypothetical protein ABIA35_009933 [Catenulispora sp. MAP12-49]|uniref:hypothetical protein n=1 Tax=unclassified Catenulispora TaxID=414885 RepID=UPI003517621A
MDGTTIFIQSHFHRGYRQTTNGETADRAQSAPRITHLGNQIREGTAIMHDACSDGNQRRDRRDARDRELARAR